MRHFFLPVTVCALAQCADREHAKAMRERIDGEIQKRWRRSAALVSAAADGDEDRVRSELINYAHPDSADSTSVTALDAALNGNHPRVVFYVFFSLGSSGAILFRGANLRSGCHAWRIEFRNAHACYDAMTITAKT